MGAKKIREAFEGDPASSNIPFSTKLWGIDWHRHLPVQAAEGVTLEYATFDQSVGFVQESFAEIFHLNERQSPFAKDHFTPAKEVYYRKLGDFFLFKEGDEIVGIACGAPLDWSSYNLRSVAFLPKAQGRHMQQVFLVTLGHILATYGVERLEGDVSPSNTHHIHALNKLGVNISGINIHDRWGALIHFVLFLQKENKRVFYDQFCQGFNPKAEGF